MTTPQPPSRDPDRLNPHSEARIPVARENAVSDEEWVGRHLGPYTIERRLSRGGMGIVLLGFDEALRRHVAIKVMDKGLLEDGDAIKRFEREARATAAVQHPNIAQVYLVGLADNDLPFLSMEYVDGTSLMEAIRARQPFSFAQVATLMEQVASALGAARKFNIIHRDIKPANIMLTRQGVAKVVDFGLAKIFFEDSYRTQEGMVLGTPSYMAPEQSQGRVVDHRADIYSLGATIYHVLLGRPPFQADSPVQIMMKHVTAPLIPMRSINPNIPIEFDEVIGRCLRKDVDERYQDYDALLDDVKRLRLQWTAREQGSIVGNAAGSSPHHDPTGRAFPAPPSGAFGASSGPTHQPGLTIQHAAGVTPYDPNSITEDGHHGWTPMRILILSAVAGVVLLAIAIPVVLKFVKPPEQQSSTVASTSEPERKPAIAVWIERLSQQQQQRGNEEKQVNPDYLAYRATLDVLDTLREAVTSYKYDNGEYPQNLTIAAEAGLVLINFEQDSTGAPIDGWGVPFAFDPSNATITSAGVDEQHYTSDDITVSIDGTIDAQDFYSEMQPMI